MACLGKYKPHIAQITAQICIAGMNVITKIAFEQGFNQFVFVAYRQAIAAVAIIPFAYFLERKKRPALTWTIFWQIFLLALCGIAANQNFYFGGLAYTSSTFASATTNLIPAVTFLMATVFGMERLNIRSKRGAAKVCGTAICVGGAMVMTLYKGSVIELVNGSLQALNVSDHDWTIGALLLFGSCILWSAWLTFQTPVVKKYPAQQSFTAIMLVQGTVQSVIVGFLFERNLSAWALKWDMALLSVVYSGILCSAFAFFVQAYCIHEKGPVFAAVFNPLSTIVVAILEYFILHDDLHVGSVVGAVLIIIGLYVVLWGKAKDHNNIIIDPTKEEESPNGNLRVDNDIPDCNIEIKQPLLGNETSFETPSHSYTQIIGEDLNASSLRGNCSSISY